MTVCKVLRTVPSTGSNSALLTVIIVMVVRTANMCAHTCVTNPRVHVFTHTNAHPGSVPTPQQAVGAWPMPFVLCLAFLTLPSFL